VELTTTLYGELHRLAMARMSMERAPQTLQATALIHEAWLRMGGENQPSWANRREFVCAAARTMRRILIDRARRRRAIRHGGGHHRVEMDAWDWEKLNSAKADHCDGLLILLEEALGELGRTEPDVAELLELHYFSGVTQKELAELLDLSERTARRRMTYARARLEEEIEKKRVTP
jgi:RNA polymerase sigma factor (TIGR02999 family)